MNRKTKVAVGFAAGGALLLLAGGGWGGTPVLGGGGSGGGGSGGGGSGGGGSGGGGSGGGGSGGGGSGGGGSGGGGSGGGGSGKGKVPSTPTDGPGGKGTIYGDPAKLPGGFNLFGNGIWISLLCDAAAVGHYFYPPESDYISALGPTDDPNYVPGKEVAAVLASDSKNSIAGFIDWMFDNDKIGGNVVDFVRFVEFYLVVAAKMKAMGRPKPLKSSTIILVELIKQVHQNCIVRKNSDGTVIYPAQVAAQWGPGFWQFVADWYTFADQYIHESWGSSIAFELEV